jgi:HD domain
MQGHVAIGSVIVKQTPDMPPAAPRAVLEHHEIPDGTGYLSGRRDDELGVMGQVIGVADAMCALLIKWQAQSPLSRGPRDLIPILRVNSYVYHRGACSALIQVIRDLNLREVGLVDDAQIDSFSASVAKDRDFLCSYAASIAEVLELIPPTSSERMSVKSVFIVHRHLKNIIHSSGILDAGHAAWLRKVATDHQRALYRDVEDVRLMLDELRWQLVKLTRLIRNVEQDKNAMNVEEHQRFLAKLESLPALPAA